MKVNSKQQSFEPVTITLETLEEFKIMAVMAKLDSTIPHEVCRWDSRIETHDVYTMLQQLNKSLVTVTNGRYL